jgi:hypothetical protein
MKATSAFFSNLRAQASGYPNHSARMYEGVIGSGKIVVEAHNTLGPLGFCESQTREDGFSCTIAGCSRFERE